MKPVIVVECDNDELLLRIIGMPRERIQHEGNRDEVVKYVVNNAPGRFIGLIDEDPGTQFGAMRQRFKSGRPQHGLSIASNGPRRLVVLSPFLEGWLLQAVKACGGRLSALDKGLSDDARALHRQFSPRGDQRMRKVIAFLQRERSAHLKALRKALDIPG